ncbi:MAG TPA: twin-arginine translocation signal domain-containing protein [Usitatibacteraceae bacterium]|nr:twin-arginine translocation signal domain-containing protein [Usitatibacteraceae bacterium]
MDSNRLTLSAGHGHTPAQPRAQIALTRREFLKGTGILAGTIAASSILSALAPSRVWALELKALSSAQGDAILQMGKVLYPHKGLPDAVYALLARDLDGAAGKDPKTAKMLGEGITALDKAAGGSFVAATDAKKLAAVKSLEGTPFFGTVRGQCITSLYDNEMAFAHFGYPGPSWDKGGYVLRGFGDLKWLPDPPASASPAPYKA